MMGAMVPKAIWRQFAIVATLIVVTVAVYAPGLGGGFFFDDYPNIVDNPQVQPRELSTGSLIAAALSSPSSELKRPLASLTFALDYFVNGGLNATSMKATNIALHVINGLLVYLLFSALFRVSRNDTYSEKSATFVAAAAALAWLLLPINLTAVLYVVQRMESLANLFVLIGLLGYVRTRERMQRGEPGLLRVAAWIIVPAALGTTAKETSILLPLYGLCVEVFVFRFQRRHDSPARDRRREQEGGWTRGLILPCRDGSPPPSGWSAADRDPGLTGVILSPRAACVGNPAGHGFTMVGMSHGVPAAKEGHRPRRGSAPPPSGPDAGRLFSRVIR